MFFKLTPPSAEVAIDAMRLSMLPKFSAAGITAVFDAGIATMPTESGYDGYQQLERENELPVRVVGSYIWKDPKTQDPVEAC